MGDSYKAWADDADHKAYLKRLNTRYELTLTPDEYDLLRDLLHDLIQVPSYCSLREEVFQLNKKINQLQGTVAE